MGTSHEGITVRGIFINGLVQKISPADHTIRFHGMDVQNDGCLFAIGPDDLSRFFCISQLKRHDLATQGELRHELQPVNGMLPGPVGEMHTFRLDHQLIRSFGQQFLQFPGKIGLV